MEVKFGDDLLVELCIFKQFFVELTIKEVIECTDASKKLKHSIEIGNFNRSGIF